MEAGPGVRYDRRGKIADKRAVVRYADDFVVFCESREDALRVKDELLPPWLAERGLVLSEEKTRIVHLTEGFDFLGFNVRHYPSPPQPPGRGTSCSSGRARRRRPGKRQELREEWSRLRGHNVQRVLRRLNPIIRGWANYYRTVVASKTFTKMDDWMFHRATRYAKHTHPKKPWNWRKNRYWGRLNPERNDHWVFGDKHTGGTC